MMSWTCLSIAEVVADFFALPAQCVIARLKCIGPNAYAANAKQASPKSSAQSSFSFAGVMARVGGRRVSIGMAPEMRRLAEPFLHAPSERSIGGNQLLVLADRMAATQSERVEAGSVKQLKEQECRQPVLLRRGIRQRTGKLSHRSHGHRRPWPGLKSVKAPSGAEFLAFGRFVRTQLSFSVANFVGRGRGISGDHGKDQQKITQLDDYSAADDAKNRRTERGAAQIRPDDHDRQRKTHSDNELWQ
ncbi:hypothetical protein NKH23_26845 [Mesorhizobium sp. M1328]|uniref:hypothetical protein n=1 Tax=Mesorhizobium sp. M1328 TaxID=2957082 RepID=UPI00333D515C